ncbi:hypothetical protein [Phaeobacter sp. 22II1-1F12B]|uniref:hypothetical protein n=1 Tax=Phaeobacter sp. 22II1-1F12B TaxID=1317111 RepID=UPI0011858770|nr:hypothetical protein [Phaeobacter sp. 22II1-1F12B]
MEEELKRLIDALAPEEVSRLSRCFRFAEETLGSPEEHQVAFAEFVAQLYLVDRSVDRFLSDHPTRPECSL